MTDAGIPDVYGAPRKRTRADDDDDDEEDGAEGVREAQAKRPSNGADADLMALLERIDSMDNNNFAYVEHQQEQRLSGVMKSLAEEVGLDPSPDAGGDLQTGDFNFFLDDDRYAMDHFPCDDHYGAPYAQAWAPDDAVDYAEVAEIFHGSLWEDDIWQPQDAGEIPQPL